MKHLLFIVNRLHLHRSGMDIAGLVNRYLDKNRFTWDIVYSEYPGHCRELAISNRDKYDIILAAGGDGTINEIGQVLAGTDIILGIIPIGSGNGLARTILKMPPSVIKSFKVINALNIKTLDMGLINGRPFFNMAGLGFDADVAHSYNLKEKRGFISYLRTVVELYFRYRSRTYEISFENQVLSVNAFLISFANSSQWGYGAHICPGADPYDGFLGITIIHAFPKIIIPVLAWRLFTGNINRSRFVQVLIARNILVTTQGEINGHIDGNPIVFRDNIQVELVHNAVRVIAV